MPHKETSSVRHLILPFLPECCNGIDVGFGGDKIRDDFIGCDLPHPYGKYEGYPIDLKCNVADGIPVADDTFDVVYSSHLIEDFADTSKILREFIRIGKDGGLLILVFPDQQRYVKFCQETGQQPNQSHKIAEMGIDYLAKQVELTGSAITKWSIEWGRYNCILVCDINKNKGI